MNDYTDEALRAALPPIASLISKSEKARQKLSPGTWQHAMLEDNLKALRIASALMNGEAGDADGFTQADLQAALRALSSMIARSENAHVKFAPGTAQHTLLRNRIAALRVAEGLIQRCVDSP